MRRKRLKIFNSLGDFSWKLREQKTSFRSLALSQDVLYFFMRRFFLQEM
jgi:hypothetical protein